MGDTEPELLEHLQSYFEVESAKMVKAQQIGDVIGRGLHLKQVDAILDEVNDIRRESAIIRGEE